jgi:hypothetical protein
MGRFIRSRWLSAVLASLLVLWLRPLPASDAGCPDAELFSAKLITDICWACLFPIRIAGLSIGGGERPDAASDQVVCVCSDGLGVAHPGTDGLLERSPGGAALPLQRGGVETDCTALEEDPECGFISSECVKYAQGESGLCYVFEETWDCGTLQGIPVLEGSTSMDCAGPVRCMGEDCLDAAEEQSSDFAEAAAALEAAQMAV